MAIPGSTTTKIEIRAKVRVGEKSDKGYPRSTDHFVSEDPEVPENCSDLVIEFPHAEPEDAFRTGLEWWQGKVLACYSDEGGADPTAFRVAEMKVKENGREKTLSWLDPDDVKRGALVGQGRQPIACRFRQCPHFGSNADNKQCRPKGRLTFLIPGGRTDQALQFETKGWNTIEQISSTLAACRRSGPLNAPGRTFLLSVRMEQKGTSRYPVVSITEASVPEVTTETIPLADALVALRKIVEEESTEAEIKLRICDVLDITNQGWRDVPEFIVAMQKRVEEIGVVAAAKGLLARYEA